MLLKLIFCQNLFIFVDRDTRARISIGYFRIFKFILKMYSLKVLVILFLITTPDAFGFWFFGGKSSEDTSNDAEENTLEVINNAKDPKFKHVPFEIKTVDERLLQESLSISQLSQLDSCFHMVILKFVT